MDETIKEDLSEIKTDIKELLQRSAVHNEILRTHEARSLALQKSQDILDVRLDPIEHHVRILNAVLKVIGVASSGIVVGLVVHGIVKVYL